MANTEGLVPSITHVNACHYGVARMLSLKLGKPQQHRNTDAPSPFDCSTLSASPGDLGPQVQRSTLHCGACLCMRAASHIGLCQSASEDANNRNRNSMPNFYGLSINMRDSTVLSGLSCDGQLYQLFTLSIPPVYRVKGPQATSTVFL